MSSEVKPMPYSIAFAAGFVISCVSVRENLFNDIRLLIKFFQITNIGKAICSSFILPKNIWPNKDLQNKWWLKR
jgi:hypothetical protein